MESRERRGAESPAADAAGLLLRIGFGILVLVAPVAAVFSRRAFVVLVPVGSLLIAGSALLLDAGGLVRRVRGAIISPVGVAVLFFFGWLFFSLVWTPFPGAAAERGLRTLGNVVMALVVANALPERMRASNLNLMTIGVALATLALCLSVLAGPFIRLTMNPEAPTFARASVAISVMVWPAVAWTFIRGRDWQGLALVATSALACAASGSLDAAITLVSALLVFMAARTNSRLTARVLSIILPAIVLFAPALAFASRAVASALALGPDTILAQVGLWASQIASEPVRLFTGHGFDTTYRAQIAGLINPAAPDGLLPMLWYDLGLPGAVLLAIVLYSSLSVIAGQSRALAPAVLSGLTACFVFALLDVTATQAWWLSVSVVLTVMLVAVRHGLYRTVRPTAEIAGRPTVAVN
ncbi:MAG: hypothetical protein LCH61_03125 [Proteobacteria bacterium]|nr:hypothetical protein [Pseudomonadota bacterium]